MNEAAVLDCARRFTIRLPRRRPRGLAGERLGAGTGASLEFEDYREYRPGDDLRHVDWQAFARRDELVVRLYREEVAPHLEVIVDRSASMVSTPEKEARLRELLTLFLLLGRTDRLDLTFWFVGGGVERFKRDLDERLNDLVCTGTGGLEEVLEAPPSLRPNGIRVVVSDLLFPAEPTPLVRILGQRSALTVFIQLLDDDEHDPDFGGGVRLTDVETAAAIDIVVNERTRAAYLRRLNALRSGYRDELTRTGGALAVVTGGTTLEAAAAGPLREAGVLGVRGLEVES